MQFTGHLASDGRLELYLTFHRHIHFQQVPFQVADEDGVRGGVEQGPVAVFGLLQCLGALPDRLLQMLSLPAQRLLRCPKAQHDPELGDQFDMVDGPGDKVVGPGFQTQGL